jgi:hypothetical protein
MGGDAVLLGIEWAQGGQIVDERKGLGRRLAQLEQDLKKLEIRYEQYFAGVEKREPIKDREELGARLHQFVNRRIIQTDLRFKCQNLATRFHSYANHWDRILRLIEEGKYHRGNIRSTPPPSAAPATKAAGPDPGSNVDSIYRELVKAHETCGSAQAAPNREKVAAFLETQKEKIREKFGDRDIEFRVVTENGKPKIKVRSKQ